MKGDRLSDFRTATWYLLEKIIPQMPPALQPSLAKIAQLLSNHFFSPEESEKVYHELRKIWRNVPLDLDSRIRLLAYCAWKLRLYLTFENDETHGETAYQLFRELIQIIRRGEPSLEELEAICLPNSERFPLPDIHHEYINFLYVIAKVCQQEQGSVTLKRLTELTTWSRKKVNSFLRKLEIAFGCFVATEALGLYDVRVEINLSSNRMLLQLLNKFKPFALRCEVHSPKLYLKSLHSSNFIPERLSVEFYYPISQKDSLIEWARRNRLQLYIRLEQHLYQNFNVFYRESWHAQKVTRIKADAFQISIQNRKTRIELSKAILQIVETYLKQTTFSVVNEPGTIAELIPFSYLGEHLGLREDWARNTASTLFNNGILVRFFLSFLLGFDPEILVEGDELSLHGNAQQYLYARRETLQPFDDNENGLGMRLYRLYVPEVSKQTIEQIGFRIIKRLHYAPPPPIHVADYNFKQSCWKSFHLPKVHDIL